MLVVKTTQHTPTGAANHCQCENSYKDKLGTAHKTSLPSCGFSQGPVYARNPDSRIGETPRGGAGPFQPFLGAGNLCSIRLARRAASFTVRALYMSQQYNKVIKRSRRKAYLKRRKQALKQRVGKKSGTKAAAAESATPAA